MSAGKRLRKRGQYERARSWNIILPPATFSGLSSLADTIEQFNTAPPSIRVKATSMTKAIVAITESGQEFVVCMISAPSLKKSVF